MAVEKDNLRETIDLREIEFCLIKFNVNQDIVGNGARVAATPKNCLAAETERRFAAPHHQ